MTRRKRALRAVAIILVILMVMSVGSLYSFNYLGLTFYDRGMEMVTILDKTAKAVQSRNIAEIEGDYDNDGKLDLYVGRYLDPRIKMPTTLYTRNGEPNQFYHNNGDGTFTNVTEKAGMGEIGACLGTVWGDYDDDGCPPNNESGVSGVRTSFSVRNSVADASLTPLAKA